MGMFLLAEAATGSTRHEIRGNLQPQILGMSALGATRSQSQDRYMSVIIRRGYG
jgi:hypothetical protein